MQITAKPKRGQEVTPAQKPKISSGMMVACFVVEYRDEIPQIGNILEVTDDQVKLQWWTGTYSGTWTALTRKEGRKSVPWTEIVPLSSILFEVSLTRSSKLSKKIKQKLEKAYQPLLAPYE